MAEFSVEMHFKFSNKLTGSGGRLRLLSFAKNISCLIFRWNLQYFVAGENAILLFSRKNDSRQFCGFTRKCVFYAVFLLKKKLVYISLKYNIVSHWKNIK